MRFSIRDLFLVTLAVGWWLEHRVHVEKSRRLSSSLLLRSSGWAHINYSVSFPLV
jgi:hypothetical protein